MISLAKRRLAAAVAADDEHDFAAAEREVDRAEHEAVRLAFAAIGVRHAGQFDLLPIVRPASASAVPASSSSSIRPNRSICATDAVAQARNGSQPMICSSGDIRYKIVSV